MPSIINASSTGSGGIVQTADASGVLQLQSNGTVALTINSGGSNLSIGPYTNSSSGTFNGTLQIGSNLQLMSYASGANTQTQLASNTYYSAGYKAIAGGAGASKLFLGGPGTWELSGSQVLTNAGDAITFVNTLGCSQTGYTVYLQGANSSASGTGLTFPATQNASSDANTLDDYEEGSWTVSLYGGTVQGTPVTGSGTYIKIGKAVYARWTIDNFSRPTGASGQVLIGGLPFTIDGSASSLSHMPIGLFINGLGTGTSYNRGAQSFRDVVAGGTVLRLQTENNTSSDVSDVQISNLGTSYNYLRCEFVYQTTA